MFAVLKPELSKHAKRPFVKADTPVEYTLETEIAITLSAAPGASTVLLWLRSVPTSVPVMPPT